MTTSGDDGDSGDGGGESSVNLNEKGNISVGCDYCGDGSGERSINSDVGE